MNAIRCILSGIIALLTVACGPSGADRARLERAEAIVRQQPDSALVVLDSITPDALNERDFRTRAAIVEAEAAYQSSRRLLSDSLLDEAVDYYLSQPDSPRRLRTLYLRGYQNYLAERYGNAIVDYLTAEQSAKQFSDSISLGLIYRGMGDTYYEIKDYRNSLNNYLKSNSVFEALRNPAYFPYSALLLGQGYYNASEYTNCLNTLQPLICKKEDFDSIEQATLYSLIAFSHMNLNQYAEANCYIDTVTTFYPNYLSERFLQNAGHLAYIQKNGNDFEFFKEALSTNYPNNKWLDYLDARNQKDYKRALVVLQNEYNATDSFYTQALSNDIRNIALDYARNRNDYLQEKAYHTSLALLWTISVSLLIIICLVIYLLYKHRIQAMVNENHNEFVRQLSDTIERYKAESAERMNPIPANNPSILQLPPRFDALSALCETFYSYKATKNIKSRIYDDLITLISSLKLNSSQFCELTEFIDSNYNNIYTQFRADNPTANENELEIFAFLVLGFSSKVIAVIQDISTEQFYARKTYLKKKIAKSAPETASKYLSYF